MGQRVQNPLSFDMHVHGQGFRADRWIRFSSPKVADSMWSLCNRGQPIVEVHRSICRGKIMVNVLEKHG